MNWKVNKMKLDELIEELQEAMKTHGNLDVYIRDDHNSYVNYSGSMYCGVIMDEGYYHEEIVDTNDELELLDWFDYDDIDDLYDSDEYKNKPKGLILN